MKGVSFSSFYACKYSVYTRDTNSFRFRFVVGDMKTYLTQSVKITSIPVTIERKNKMETKKRKQKYTVIFVILSVAAWIFFTYCVCLSYAKPSNDDIFGHSLDWIFHGFYALELLAGQLGLYHSSAFLLFEADDGMEPAFGKVIILIGSTLALLHWLTSVLHY